MLLHPNQNQNYDELELTKEKSALFVKFFLNDFFFQICVLFQCIVYWKDFWKIERI